MTNTWTFLTNHARVLLCIARDPRVRMHDIAEEIGIRERSVQQIVADLEQGGYLSRQRDGRRNTYTVHRRAPFRHAAEAKHDIGELLEVFTGGRRDVPATGECRLQTTPVLTHKPSGRR